MSKGRPIAVTRRPIPLFVVAALASGAAGAEPPEGVLSAAFHAEVDRIVVEKMESEHLPGVAFVLVYEGKIQLARGWGKANLEREISVDPDNTLFRIGSISKVLTALALAQQEGRGKISLDEDVNRYLDSRLVPSRFGEPVRVRHLVTHTGGFDQTGLGRHARSAAERPSLASFLAENLIRIRPPGVVSTYDTYGITLAGHLVERVTGMDYAEYMRQGVFEPLGMERTFVEAPQSIRKNLAVGYGFRDGDFVPQPYEIYVTTPASSIDATARDMGRLLVALLGDGSNEGGRLFDAETAKRVREPQFREHPEFPGFNWGFWEVLREPWRAIHHGGSMLGFTSELWMVPEKAVGFFLTTNRDGDAGGGPVRLHRALGRALMERLYPGGPTLTIPDEPLPVDTRPVEGNWAATLYCHTCRGGEGWPMYYAPVESVAPGVIEYEGRRWLAQGGNAFASADDGSRIAFVEDRQGRVRYMVHGSYMLTREKLDDTLLDEVFGSGWREDGPPPPLAAEVWRANAEWEKAAVAYEALAPTRQEPGRAWYRAGNAWLRLERIDRATTALERAFEAGPWKARAAYGLAVAYAMQRQTDPAFHWLRAALEHGLEEPEMLREDARLAGLREDPRFAKLIAPPPVGE
jgi:CubicO group peptidase (beta-lactamase class C family)